MSIIKWIFDSTIRTFTGLFILGALASIGIQATQAALSTTYDVTNSPQYFLGTSITTTQTTGITLSSPRLNGANYQFGTATGGVLRIFSGNFREDISYTSATVNATTNVVTLVGVTRNICPNVTRSYVSCGAGRNWGKGAFVELNFDARLINLKANIDRLNTFSARQKVSGSGYFMTGYFATTAARDQALGATPATASGLSAFVDATGLAYDGLGGSWVARGSNATSNATESASGKAEAATITDQQTKNATGDSGAPLFLQPKNLASSGSTAANGRIPVFSGSTLDESILGSGTSSGRFLRGNNYGQPQWSYIRSSSGSLTINSFQSGVLLDIKKSNTSFFMVRGASDNGHIVTGGTAPTIGGCGTSPSIVGNDTAGKLTGGTGTPTMCAVYFNKPYPLNRVSCSISTNEPTDSAYFTTMTSSGFNVRVGSNDLTSAVIFYTCLEF